jgi:D-amino-acid dehydrogenase
MAAEKSILVVGGGVIGLSTAYYCARRGHQVTLLDRNPEQRDGCSFGNAGMVTPSHFVPLAAPGIIGTAFKWMWNPESPLYIKPRLNWDLLSWGWKFMGAANVQHMERSAPVLRDLSFASCTCFEELAALANNEFGLVQKGLIMLCLTQQSVDHEAAFARQANELGVPAEVLDTLALKRLEPNMTMNVAGGVYFPKDCHLTPSRFMASLKQQCDKVGVNFLWETETTSWRSSHNGRLEAVTCRGPRGTADYSGDEFVLCAGSWSPSVVRELGLKLPMQAGKGYSLTLQQPRELPQICAICTEARVAVTPMGQSLRFGGTMEIAGLNEDINPVRVQGIIKTVPRYFPKFTACDFEGVQPWRGLRPCSPDGLPYVGRTTRFKNLSVATGHAMMGLSLGPITGKLISEVLSGQTPSIDIQLLNPDRYA